MSAEVVRVSAVPPAGARPLPKFWDVAVMRGEWFQGRGAETATARGPTPGSSRWNCVAMLGGWDRRARAGGKPPLVRVPEDEVFYYDASGDPRVRFDQLDVRLRRALSTAPVFQFVLDRIPWALRRGVAPGAYGEYAAREDENTLPPGSARDWAWCVRETVKHVVREFPGAETWQYRVHTEGDCRCHWNGSFEEFCQHYANTARAVRDALPGAKVGTHFVAPWSEGSFARPFVAWCRGAGVPLDFVGWSLYPTPGSPESNDFDYLAEALAVEGAAVQVHEYQAWTAPLEVDRGLSAASHLALMAELVVSGVVGEVFQWDGRGPGPRLNPSQITRALLEELVGRRAWRLPGGGGIVARWASGVDLVWHRLRRGAASRVFVIGGVPPGAPVSFRACVVRRPEFSGRLAWSEWKRRDATPEGTVAFVLRVQADGVARASVTW